jgi:FAD-linked oxidoreductase
MTARKRTWRNWSGSIRCSPAWLARPNDIDGVRQVVVRAKRDGRRIRVVGSGHSFSPLVATDDVLLSLERLRGIERLDRARGTVTVRAGTTLRSLGRALHAHELALENLGGIDSQTVAGAVSTGTHGTGMHFGSLCTQVVGMALVTADGAAVECSAERHPDLFQAARMSLGALGVITGVAFRVVPAQRLQLETRREPFANCLDRLSQYRRAHQRFELFWFPHTGWVQTRFLDPANRSQPLSRLRRQVSDLVLENGLLWALAEACRWRPSLSPWASALCARHAPRVREVDWSHRLLVSPRLVRMEAMEYAIAAEDGPHALLEIQRAVARHRFPVSMPLGCRFVRGDDVWISPAYRRDSVCIAAHAYPGMRFEPYFREVERILQAHGGRPHWGKWHTASGRELARLYPRWDDFQSVRRSVDPAGLFLNDYLRELFERAKPALPARQGSDELTTA